MLRGQPPDINPMDFLAGQSEMAGRIRSFDWTAHPIGPPNDWPQSLRSALSICLHSAFPTAIYWGSELRLLYNDAWAPIPGPRHPAALGAPAREVWYDIWDVIEPQFRRVIATGEGVAVEDQLLPMRRYGLTEETYWNYSFTPIRGEDGRIVGVFNSGHETTRNVLAGRQMRFLLDMSEGVRALPTFAAVRAHALRLLGEHLSVDRVGLRFSASLDDELTITDEWTATGVASVGRTMPVEDLGETVARHVAEGRALKVTDTMQDQRLRDSRDTMRRLGVGAAIAVPWTIAGRTAAVLFVHSSQPRNWSDFEIDTVEEVLERIMGWAEREQVAERERTMMREIDHRAKNVLAVVQSVVRLTSADDVATVREKIGDRVRALARTHDLLSSRRWRDVDLKTLMSEELEPYAGDHATRISLDGPPLPLSPELAQTFALLLHEMATNAAKYGALSTPDGKLSICWTLSGDDLTINWREQFSGLALQPMPKFSTRGFGSELLETVIEKQMQGSLRKSLTDDGLEYKFRIPLPGRGHRESGENAPQLAASPNVTSEILIVEDDPLIAFDLVSMIEGMNLKVLGCAGSVDESLILLEKSRPGLAILDANLGDQSSRLIAERLVEANIPVIYASGFSEISDIPDPLRNAPKLLKPISSADLKKAIDAVGFPLPE
jgi:two-component sensor histidine kinase